jgi:hypothetical protein
MDRLTHHRRWRHHRQLRQLLFEWMEFQIIDQQRGAHHAGLRNGRRAAD